jgi:hypothetical protein
MTVFITAKDLIEFALVAEIDKKAVGIDGQTVGKLHERGKVRKNKHRPGIQTLEYGGPPV